MIATNSRIEWRGRAYLEQHLKTGNGAIDATLAVDRERISLATAIGTINMSTGTVSRIERAGLFPWLRLGILIHHHSRHQVFRFVPTSETTTEVLNHLKELGYWVVN